MKGIKQDINKASFSRSTLKGIIRKGFVNIQDIDKTRLTEYTKQKIQEMKLSSEAIYFVRDKNFCFAIDKNKIYEVSDCVLPQYIEYVKKQNEDKIKKNELEVVKVEDFHPSDLRARGLAVDKIVEAQGITL